MSDAARAQMLARQRRQARVRAEKMRTDRKLAVATGVAAFVSPREYAVSAGVHVMTVYRLVGDGRLRAKKIGKGKRGGRLADLRRPDSARVSRAASNARATAGANASLSPFRANCGGGGLMR